jgi:hypothetical protein
MALHSLGKIAVGSPGTPVQITVNQSTPSSRIGCQAIMVQTLPTNTGKIYVGLAGMNKTTLAQVLAILAVPTVNTIPAYSATLSYAPGGLNAADLYIDADNGGEGALAVIVSG